jgi:hypothetical protein
VLEKLVIAKGSHTHTHTHIHCGTLKHSHCFSIERSGLKLTGIKLGNPEIIRLELVDLCVV